jgi:tetratricopeptide (TPR) repeat protein
VRLWDAATGEPVATLPAKGKAVVSAVFRPDGRQVAAVGYFDGANVWDLPLADRPVADTQRLAEVLSTQRIDPGAGAVSVPVAAMGRSWQRLRSRYPGDFVLRDPRALVAFRQRQAEVWVGRGASHAARGAWAEAAADFGRAGATREDPVFGAYDRALIHLARGEDAAYAALCRRIAPLVIAGVRDENYNGLWFCALTPDALPDFSEAARLLQRSVARYPADHAIRNTYGVFLYRAGRFEEAVRELDESVRLGGGSAHDWLFLAMAHQRLGRPEEADKAMALAAGWLAKNPESGMRWTDRLELQRFRREAEQVLAAAARAGKEGTP